MEFHVIGVIPDKTSQVDTNNANDLYDKQNITQSYMYIFLDDI